MMPRPSESSSVTASAFVLSCGMLFRASYEGNKDGIGGGFGAYEGLKKDGVWERVVSCASGDVGVEELLDLGRG